MLDLFNFLRDHLPHVATAVGVLEAALILLVIPWVLLTKKDATAALAWCLIVLFVPFLGAFLFWVIGYNYVRRLRRKRRHRAAYRQQHPPRRPAAARGDGEAAAGDGADELVRLARRVRAFPLTRDNAVALYHDTHDAFAALLDAIAAARHHVHLEFYIYRSDETGRQLTDLLIEKAKEGVEVRLLYDAMGCVGTRWSLFRALHEAGGRAAAFLPLNPLRSRIQVNLRNHRKIAVVDGRVGFTGGMNIGDEYLGKSRYFGYWRDEFLRLEGPAVAGLQRVFTEDWDFATGEALDREAYFPEIGPAGSAAVQVIESGPDQDVNSIREVYFAAILSARERLWIASPYFVPDPSLLDALRLARYRGVDVKLLSLARPDHFLSFYAGRYYWTELLQTGAQVYQYRKGMMHAKTVTVDGRWAMVGSANLDNRSLRLNFEACCLLHTPELVAQIEEQYQRDLQDAVLLESHAYASRSLAVRLMENGCRLFSPLL